MFSMVLHPAVLKKRKVRLLTLLKTDPRVAKSTNYLATKMNQGFSSIEKILYQLELENRVERIDTTTGTVWRIKRRKRKQRK